MGIDHWTRRLFTVVVVLSLLVGSPVFRTVGSAASPGWTTSGSGILTPAGGQSIISGINWYGFETTGFVAHGLYAKDYKYIVDEVKQYGYNTIRIPFSNEMWEKNPIPKPNLISACPSCKGTHSRDIMALIINYAGSIGLHVILDNHRSSAGNSAEGNGLWYNKSRGNSFTEQDWIRDWVNIQRWLHSTAQTQGAVDTVQVNYLALDGFPVALGFDLRNEPHSPSRASYLEGATWGGPAMGLIRTSIRIRIHLHPVVSPPPPATIGAWPPNGRRIRSWGTQRAKVGAIH